MLDGTMNHDEGHEFLCIGRPLERADMTTRIVDVRTATLLAETASGLLPFENIQWIGVLKSLTAYQMYRQRVQARVRRRDALAFLIQDDAFPRAVNACAHTVGSSVAMLPRSEAVQRALAHLRRQVQTADMDELTADVTKLHAFLDRLQQLLGHVHDEIRATYFVPAEVPEARTAA